MKGTMSHAATKSVRMKELAAQAEEQEDEVGPRTQKDMELCIAGHFEISKKMWGKDKAN